MHGFISKPCVHVKPKAVPELHLHTFGIGLPAGNSTQTPSGVPHVFEAQVFDFSHI